MRIRGLMFRITLSFWILILLSCKEDRKQPEGEAKIEPSEKFAGGLPGSRPQDQLLKLALKCGKDSLRVFYDDTLGAEAHHVIHRLHDELESPQGYFIERRLYEGGDWLLVSKHSCEDLTLFGEISFNPSRTRFASVGQDNVFGSGENGVQILSHPDPDHPIQVELEDRISIDRNSQFGPEKWKWENDSVFSVVLSDIQDRKILREYRNEEGMWTIINRPGPGDKAGGETP